jgi:hypothetical protein
MYIDLQVHMAVRQDCVLQLERFLAVVLDIFGFVGGLMLEKEQIIVGLHFIQIVKLHIGKI